MEMIAYFNSVHGISQAPQLQKYTTLATAAQTENIPRTTL